MAKSSSILIVDDNPDDIFLTKRAISDSRSDCIVEAASDGVQAMERLRNANPPTLVFLDLKMPGIGGIEILKFIRTQEHTRYVPVVILTSSTLEEDMKTSYNAPDFTEMLNKTLHYWIDVNLSPH